MCGTLYTDQEIVTNLKEKPYAEKPGKMSRVSSAVQAGIFLANMPVVQHSLAATLSQEDGLTTKRRHVSKRMLDKRANDVVDVLRSLSKKIKKG